MELIQSIGVYLVAFLVSILSSLAGIGGGVIFVPLYILTGNVKIKQAILLSIMTTIGNSLARFIYYPFQKYKDNPNRYLVNWGIIRIVVPFLANAVYIGFILNQVLPDLVVLILIGILMCGLIYKITKKTIFYYHQSNNEDFTTEINEINTNMCAESDSIETANSSNLVKERWIDVLKSLAFSILAVLMVIFFSIVREGSHMESPWLIYFWQLVVMGLFGYLTIDHLSVIEQLRNISNFPHIDGDIDWSNWKISLSFAGASSFAGILAALIGIGGGLILNPTQLHFGVNPIVMVATSSVMTFFSSIMSGSQYFINNPNNFDLIHFGVFGFGFLGACLAIILARFFGRNQKLIILVVLDICLIISLFIMIITNLMNIS